MLHTECLLSIPAHSRNASLCGYHLSFLCRYRSVAATVTASVAKPFPDRPLEGLLVISAEILPMAGSTYEVRNTVFTSLGTPVCALRFITSLSHLYFRILQAGGRPSPAAVELGRQLERQIRDARAIDVEALAIAPGEAVWALRCDVRVLDDAGNLGDAAALATIGALLHFRRPDVSLDAATGRVTVHSYTSRAPVPLAVHHIPVSITFGVFPRGGSADGAHTTGPGADDGEDADGELLALDPTDRESAVSSTSVRFVLNAHRELCGVHKLGGVPLRPAALLAAARTAAERAAALVAALQDALAAAERDVVDRDRQRHAAAAGYTTAKGAVDVTHVR